jgi:hypothetical protein
MTSSNHDRQTLRRYLLGQLTDDEQATTEQRLLTEDDFFAELELTKDEIVEEYVAEQLAPGERAWFEQNFLASPEGKQTQGFTKVLNRYVSHHPPPTQKKLGWAEPLIEFWNRQSRLLQAATAVAVVVMVVGVFWFSRAPSPRSFAVLTLTNSPSTRSTGAKSPRVKLNEDALRLTLLLPAPATPGVRYRVELLNDKGDNKISEVAGRDTQSVSVEIPAAQLPHGDYAVTLSTINANDTVQPIPGSYYFTVE